MSRFSFLSIACRSPQKSYANPTHSATPLPYPRARALDTYTIPICLQHISVTSRLVGVTLVQIGWPTYARIQICIRHIADLLPP